MATTKKRPADVIDATPADVVDRVEVLGLNRDALEQLAAAWERQADQLDNIEVQGTGNFVLDLLGGVTLGAADEARSQTLRACARELRLLLSR